MSNVHIFNNKNVFQAFKASNGHVSGIGSLPIHGTGNVTIVMFDQLSRSYFQYTLEGCLFVPNSRRNIVSVGLLKRAGCKVDLQKGELLTRSGHLVKILFKHLLWNLPALFPETFATEVSFVGGPKPVITGADTVESRPLINGINSKTLAHLRLGHVNENSLNKTLATSSGIQFNKLDKLLDICIPCLLGKMPKPHFVPNNQTASKVDQLVHTDIESPMANLYMPSTSLMTTLTSREYTSWHGAQAKTFNELSSDFKKNNFGLS